jgi:hypothetical protein
MLKHLGKISGSGLKALLKKMLVEFRLKRAKVGVSYNLFDGEELLPFSINCIRKKVHHISVVYQKISNLGNPANADIEEKLEKLKRDGLIDEIYLYVPDLKASPRKNERAKRDIGLKLAKKNGCTYFLSLDVDEFYDEKQFGEALAYIVANDVKASAVSIVEYLGSPENQVLGIHTFLPNSSELFNFYVPFLVKIRRLKRQRHGVGYFPCKTDPTRGLSNSGRFKIFSVNEIAMHHMSTIRKNLVKKYENSSALGASKDGEFLKAVQKTVLDFNIEECRKLPDDFAVYGYKVIRKVENKFGIEI